MEALSIELAKVTTSAALSTNITKTLPERIGAAGPSCHSLQNCYFSKYPQTAA
jgi:hypothetical protein